MLTKALAISPRRHFHCWTSRASNRRPWTWHLTGVTSTCATTTFRYDFNISAPAGPDDEPSFTAAGCIGTSVQGDYKSCVGLEVEGPGEVSSQEVNAGNGIGARFYVRYVSEQDGGRLTYTSMGTLLHERVPIDFDVSPTEAFAVPIETETAASSV